MTGRINPFRQAAEEHLSQVVARKRGERRTIDIGIDDLASAGVAASTGSPFAQTEDPTWSAGAIHRVLESHTVQSERAIQSLVSREDIFTSTRPLIIYLTIGVGDAPDSRTWRTVSERADAFRRTVRLGDHGFEFEPIVIFCEKPQRGVMRFTIKHLTKDPAGRADSIGERVLETASASGLTMWLSRFVHDRMVSGPLLTAPHRGSAIRSVRAEALPHMGPPSGTEHAEEYAEAIAEMATDTPVALAAEMRKYEGGIPRVPEIITA